MVNLIANGGGYIVDGTLSDGGERKRGEEEEGGCAGHGLAGLRLARRKKGDGELERRVGRLDRN